MWHVFVNVTIRWGVGVCYRRQQNHIFWITVLLWQTESAWGKESNTDYLYKLLTFRVVYMVVYSSLPVIGTTANITCVTWHWSVLRIAELLLKRSSLFESNFPCTSCFTVETWPKSHGLRLGEYGLTTLPNCNTEQHFNIADWAVTLSYTMMAFSASSGYFSLTTWQRWYCRNYLSLCSLTVSWCGVVWHTRTPWTSYTKAVLSFVGDCVETYIFRSLDDTIHSTH